MSTDNNIKSSNSRRSKDTTSSARLRSGTSTSTRKSSLHESENKSSRLQRAAVLEKQVPSNLDSDTDTSTSHVSIKSDSKINYAKTSRRLPEKTEHDVDDNSSRSGRRTSFESSKQRSERRAIANKIRSKNLVAQQSGTSQTSLSSGQDSPDDDASCSSAASRVSSRSTTSKSSKRSPSKKSTKKRNNVSDKEIKAAQFSVSVTASLLSDSEDEEFQDSISLISYGPSDLNMSSSNFNQSSKGNLDADNENSAYQNSINNLMLDGLEPSTPKFRKSKVTRQSSLEVGKSTSLKRNNSSSSSLSKMNLSLSDLFEKDKSKDKNSKKKNGERSVMGISIGTRKTESRIKDRRKDNNLKSCIKGKNKRRYIGKKEEKKAISFETSNLEQVRTVKALFRYSKELYFSEEEIEKFRIDQTNLTEATTEEINDVQMYMNAYRTGRQQINFGQMSTEVYRDLIIGIRKGYCGIEGQSELHETICSHVKDTTRSIIAAYQNALNAQKQQAKGIKKALDASVMVKAHSEALSETDRQWAVALGNAVMHAAKDKG